jgi:hypothetical protein
MKKIIHLLLLCSLGLVGFAQTGSLLISSANNQRFWLFVDDILQNEYSVPSIKLMGMSLQQYMIRVEMDNVNVNCVGQLIAINNQYNGNNYSISSRSNTYTINQIRTDVRPALTISLIQPNYNYYNDYYHYLYPGFGNPGNYWQGSGNNQGRQYQYYPNNGGGRRGGNHGGNTQPPPPPPPSGGGNYGNPCRNPMEFATAMNLLRGESFESGKLQFAKNMTVSGPICVDQIIQVCKVFDFESSRLEYAKFAYPYCNDKNLYYLVNSVFQFQSSKDELGRFIR